MAGSDCFEHFGHEQFDPANVARNACPVRGCQMPLSSVRFRAGERPYCARHGLRLHSNTFVYWNGAEREQEAKLRNVVVRPDLARAIALSSTEKAESHRLGYEMSEDALTWNVFVGLAEAGKLKNAVQFFTGKQIRQDPELYLWGERVDLRGQRRGRFGPLDEVRATLERDIRRFKTEPDAMLVADGELLVCIEAKFGSGNPLAHAGIVEEGAKPVEREQLLRRYLDRASARTREAFVRNGDAPRFHSQLFRNLVFASEMAERGGWHVVSLMSDTQRGGRAETVEYSYTDPTPDVLAHLASSHKAGFTFRSWEQLYEALIQADSALLPLGQYLREKSAHYLPAFRLDQPQS